MIEMGGREGARRTLQRPKHLLMGLQSCRRGLPQPHFVSLWMLYLLGDTAYLHSELRNEDVTSFKVNRQPQVSRILAGLREEGKAAPEYKKVVTGLVVVLACKQQDLQVCTDFEVLIVSGL